MIDRLENILKKYNELTDEISKPEVISDISLLTKLSKEHSTLSEVVTVYKKYKEVIGLISDDEELLNDSELKDIAKEELSSLYEKKR